MSVLTYLYPREIEPLAVERLLSAMRKRIAHAAISDLKLKKHAMPDWEWLTFSHPTVPETAMLAVVGRNTKTNVEYLAQHYSNTKSFSVVESARLYIWTQHKSPLNLPLKRFHQSWKVYIDIVAAVARISHAVIDSPEAGKLMTASTFQRRNRISIV